MDRGHSQLAGTQSQVLTAQSLGSHSLSQCRSKQQGSKEYGSKSRQGYSPIKATDRSRAKSKAPARN